MNKLVFNNVLHSNWAVFLDETNCIALWNIGNIEGKYQDHPKDIIILEYEDTSKNS